MTDSTIKMIKAGRKLCRDPQHNLPEDTFLESTLEPGQYEHECPSCGAKVKFIVKEFYYGNEVKRTVLRIPS